MKTNLLKEISSSIGLILVNVIMFYMLILFGNSIEYIPTVKNWKIILLIYAVVLIILFFINAKFKNKITSFLILILTLPFSVFYLVFTIGIPFLFLQIHLFLYLTFCGAIPMIGLKIYEYFNFPTLNLQLKVYLVLSMTVILATIFQKQIKFLVHKLSPARLKTSEKLRPYKIEKLSDYLLSENNIKFVVFVIFFILIVVINFSNLQELSYFQTTSVDKAVIQSFVTYIAFDRIITNLKKIEFKPSEMLKKIIESIKNKLEQIEKL
jgi:hypothetical protein